VPFLSHCAPDSTADLSLKRAQSQGASGCGEGRDVEHVADHDDASDAVAAAAVRARKAEVKPKPKGSKRRAAKAEAEQTPPKKR